MARHGDSIPINSPVRCSEPNGEMERAKVAFEADWKMKSDERVETKMQK